MEVTSWTNTWKFYTDGSPTKTNGKIDEEIHSSYYISVSDNKASLIVNYLLTTKYNNEQRYLSVCPKLDYK